MDPYMNSLAYKLLAERPPEQESAKEQARNPQWGKHLLHGLGGLLVALGQNMQAGRLDVQSTFEDTMYRSLDDEMCA